MCDRPALLDVFCRGWPPSPDRTRILRPEVLSALQHFGCVQLDRFREAGLLLWPQRTGLPAAYGRLVNWGAPGPAPINHPAPPSRSLAAYLPPVRTVVFRGEATGFVYSLTHELAHAWDDLANDPDTADSRTPLDAMTGRRRERAVLRLAREQARSRHARSTTMRATRRSPTTLEALHRAFVALRRQEGARRGVNVSFGRTGGEEALNPLEFYAEGYAVIRCGPLENQGRMLRFAPGLYDYLEAESQRHGLPLPPRDRVEVAAERAFETVGGR